MLQFFVCLLFAVPLSGTVDLSQPVKFREKKIAEILEWIDGIRYAMDGFAIKDMKKVEFQIQALQYGIKDPKSQKIIGRYIIRKNRYTLHELAQLEAEGKISTKDQFFYDGLMQACSDFGKIVDPFQDRVKGLKHFLVDLIAESCRIRNRKDSLLLDWSKCNNNEDVKFEQNINEAAEKGKGFQTLNTFLTDLRIFFGDLKYNCPKACKQYEELKLQSEHHTRTLEHGNT